MMFKTLARDDSDIAEMLELIECDFETKSIFMNLILIQLRQQI